MGDGSILQEDGGSSALLYSAHRRRKLLTRHENIQVIADKFNQHKETNQRGERENRWLQIKERQGGHQASWDSGLQMVSACARAHEFSIPDKLIRLCDNEMAI